MTEILVEKLEDALHPVDEESRKTIRNIPDKSILKIKVSVPRNVRMHRLFFAIINLTFEHQQEPRQYPTADALREALTMAVGYTREVRDLHGRTHLMPDSISFGRMDQIAFKQFFDAVIRLIIDRIIPGVEKKDFEQRLYDMLREPGPEQLERNR